MSPGFSPTRHKRSLRGLLLVPALLVGAGDLAQAQSARKPTAAATAPARLPIDPPTLERQLQQLNWEQFRQVVERIPKIKAEVDGYGVLGWQYVKHNYRSYPWQKQLVKLNDGQRQHLAQLIRRAQGG